MNPAALLGLLRLASPALPVGGFSYSEGLEAAVEAGLVRDEAQAGDWLVPTMLKVRFSSAPANCSASPNQISFSSEWRGAKRTQNKLPIR
mgnify:CR=1 FL=1